MSSVFQSSSGQKAGCNPSSTSLIALRSGFNPHPARRPDATSASVMSPLSPDKFQSSSGQKAGCNLPPLSISTHPAVSILIRPEGRMQRRSGALAWGTCRVSILIRPEGRMQPLDTRGSGECPESFNPHPARRPDATTPSSATGWLNGVSILIRPEGRMQRLYLNFLSVLSEPPDTALPICFHCPDHSLPSATIQLRTRTSKLQWPRHWVRVRPPAVP